jgi:pre-rRNA-processing protein TSR3
MVDVILRHPRERRSKCSLEPLRGRADLHFLQARPGFCFNATGYVMLDLAAPVLGAADAAYPLLLPDSTWRLLPQVLERIHGAPIRRSLPVQARSAYPRCSKLIIDPERGLASVEALFLARCLQGRRDDSLLAAYHWRAAFLAANQALLAGICGRG